MAWWPTESIHRGMSATVLFPFYYWCLPTHSMKERDMWFLLRGAVPDLYSVGWRCVNSMAEFQQTAKVLSASPEDKVILWHLFFFLIFLLNSTLSVVILLTSKFHLKNPCQIFDSFFFVHFVELSMGREEHRRVHRQNQIHRLLLG